MKTLLALFTALQIAQPSLKAQLPSLSSQPASQTVRPGATVKFTVGVFGAGPFTYQWQLNGTNLPKGIITTVAGNGVAVDSGDGGPATSASLANPTGVAVDAFENLFIAGIGPGEHGVRKVGLDGIIATIPGVSRGYGSFVGLATDASGNLFVAAQRQGGAEHVRKVDTNGNVSIVAGKGGWDVGSLGDGGPATRALLNGPCGVALDGAGNLFIADEFNERVRKVSAKGIITTVAGNGRQGHSRDGRSAIHSQLHYPSGVAVDTSGNLFVVDEGNKLIRKVDPKGIITTVAGGGTVPVRDGDQATNVDLYILSRGLVVDGLGNLLFSTFLQVRKVDTNGIITTVAGNGAQGYSGDGGPAIDARLGMPHGVALDACGNLFIADMMSQRIRKVGNTHGPALVLNNVSADNAGNYRVVITGTAGSVTSSVAALAVNVAPRLQ